MQCSLQELKELIASYQTLREGGRGDAICATIIETARQCNLDRDVALPSDATASKDLGLDERDGIVGRVYSKCDPPGPYALQSLSAPEELMLAITSIEI